MKIREIFSLKIERLFFSSVLARKAANDRHTLTVDYNSLRN